MIATLFVFMLLTLCLWRMEDNLNDSAKALKGKWTIK
jgi:hypothetical protein